VVVVAAAAVVIVAPVVVVAVIPTPGSCAHLLSLSSSSRKTLRMRSLTISTVSAGRPSARYSQQILSLFTRAGERIEFLSINQASAPSQNQPVPVRRRRSALITERVK
jgi:hypothetical protein